LFSAYQIFNDDGPTQCHGADDDIVGRLSLAWEVWVSWHSRKGMARRCRAQSVNGRSSSPYSTRIWACVFTSSPQLGFFLHLLLQHPQP
jgi:hypothetical protein